MPGPAFIEPLGSLPPDPSESVKTTNSRITVEEIAERLDIGRSAVYDMLKQNIIPNIRVGRRWIITRHAYGYWERRCGLNPLLDFTRTQR
jgi:excisionase family DNA binding protein